MRIVEDRWLPGDEPAKVTMWQYSVWVRGLLIVWTLVMVGIMIWAAVDAPERFSTWVWMLAGLAALWFLWDYCCRRATIRP